MPNTDGGATNPPVTYCPILGTNFLPRAMGPIVRGGQPELQMEQVMSRCVEANCAMWDVDRKACTVKLAGDALVHLGELAKKHESKLGILGLFQKKG